MSSRIVQRVAHAKPSEEEIRLAALASIAARRARIAAVTAKLEVPTTKHDMQFAPLPACQQARSLVPLRPRKEGWTDANLCKLFWSL